MSAPWPWAVSKTVRHDERTEVRSEPLGRLVALVDSAQEARLIAAAPELLAALKRVGCQDAGCCGEPHPVLRPDGLCFVCRAIAKAEGNS
jgi:hypothetical protein